MARTAPVLAPSELPWAPPQGPASGPPRSREVTGPSSRVYRQVTEKGTMSSAISVKGW